MIFIVSDISFELLSRYNHKIKIITKSFIEIIQLSKGEFKLDEKIEPNEDILVLSLSGFSILKIIGKTNYLDIKKIEDFLKTFIENLRNDLGINYILISNPFNLMTCRQNKFKSLPIKYFNLKRNFLLKYQLAIEELSQKDQKISKLDISDLAQINSSKSLKQFLFTSSYIDRNNYREIGERIVQSSNYLKQEIIKVLALDLDNTLWGGILREDGKENLIICGHNPKGELFRVLQQLFKDLKNKGILLALITKNDLDDVVSAFNFNDFMPLQKSDFVSIKASDFPKSKLIKELSEDLNISLKHILFLDDSSFERREVKENASDVYVIDLPTDHYSWPEILLSDERFSKTIEIISSSDEKVNRTEQYIARKKRIDLRESLYEENDFYKVWLKELNQKLTFTNIYSPTKRTIELFSRTNQFNSSGNKYTFDQLNNFLKNNYKIIEISLKDNYGDEGVISVLILNINNRVITVYDFILSCRVFGRYIEEIILFSIYEVLDIKSKEYPIQIIFEDNGRNKKSCQFFSRLTDENKFLLLGNLNKDIIKSTEINFQNH